MIPIFDNRQIIGYAKTAKQAQSMIEKMLQHTPKGWRVTVRMRNTEIIDLPAGWIYSVYP